jgi:nuclear GTP-binding protein
LQARWVKVLSKEYPTLAFHANINNSFGKGSLIQLLRQFSNLHADKKQISVGFIGYPNIGKSSIINTLRGKKVCTVAPLPGETKVWQYITLMKRIYLIDCPGVVYPAPEDTETDTVLKGVVRVENIPNPEDHIEVLLARVRREYIAQTYGVPEWTDYIDFLDKICKKSGKLLKGGEPDHSTIAKMILNDWIRGRIPFYTAPPEGPVPEVAGGKAIPSTTPSTTPSTAAAPSGDRAERRKPLPTVSQLFDKINVTSKFLAEDMTREEEDDGEAQEEGAESATAATGSSKKGSSKRKPMTAKAPTVDWDDVFQESVGEVVQALPSGTASAAAPAAPVIPERDSDIDDSEPESEVEVDEGAARAAAVAAAAAAEEEASPKKKVRMTTNKGKVGTHYYETANVKNRNRDKKVQAAIKLRRK